MKAVSYIICNSGDGSSHLEWFSEELTPEQLRIIEQSDLERYSSGGGIQYKTMKFPNDFDVQLWAYNNYIFLSSFNEWVEDNLDNQE